MFITSAKNVSFKILSQYVKNKLQLMLIKIISGFRQKHKYPSRDGCEQNMNVFVYDEVHKVTTGGQTIRLKENCLHP